MTVIEDQPDQQAPEMTREQVKRQLVEALAAAEASKAAVTRAWEIVTARQIPVEEFSAAIDADSRIPKAHFTTWGRRRNKELGIDDYRTPGANVQRRMPRGKKQQRNLTRAEQEIDQTYFQD